MAHVVEIAIRGIDEATRVFDDVSSTAKSSMEQAEASVNAVDDSINNVSDLDIDTGDSQQAMENAEKSVQNVEVAIQETEQTGLSFGDKMRDVFDKVNDAWKEITLVSGTAGLGMEGFARSQGEVNATFDRTAIATGMTADELRDMAVDMADATTNTDQQAEAMEMLVQRGIDTEEQFREIIPHVSNLGTATGQDLQPALESADRLLKPFGQNMDDVGDNVDQMARIMMQTDIPLGALERNLGRVPDELKELEFGLDDAAAGIEVFRERGFEGREAVREFRRAVDDSDGDMNEFLDTIGLTAEEWEEYQDKVEPQAGLAEKIADANENNMTVMEKLHENVSNLMVEYGAFAELAGMLAPILMSLGPIMKGVSMATKLFNLVLMANPIVLVIGAIVALIAIIAVLWNYWEEITEFLSTSWEWIKELAIEHFGGLGEYFLEFWEWLKELFFTVWEAIVEFLSISWEKITEVFNDSIEWIIEFISNAWEWISELTNSVFTSIKEFFSSIWNGILDVLETIISSIVDFFQSSFNTIKDFIIDIWNGVKDFTSTVWNTIVSVVQGIINGFQNTISNIFNAISNVISNVWNTVSSISSSVWGGISGTVSGIVSGISSTISSVFGTIESTISSVWNGVKSTTESIWESMTTVVKGPINTIIGFINGMIDAINSVSIDIPKIPDWIPGLGGKGGGSIGFNIPNVPSLATGGVVSSPTLAIVGDAGAGNPEIVAPQKMIAQIVGEELKKILGAVTSVNQYDNRPLEIIVPVYIDGREVAKVTAPYMDRELGNRRNRKSRAEGD